MKVSICSIGKCENRYIREFVEFYKNIEVDKIYLYDNNDIDGEHFQDVIADYINDGFVELIDYRGKITIDKNDKVQLRAYNDCYQKYGNQYDWMCFFDIDEFLILPIGYKTIKEWLSNEKFSKYGNIQINWKCYGDNELLYYEDKPLMERFTTPSHNGNESLFIENFLRKCIIRGKAEKILWNTNPHTPLTPYAACNSIGEPLNDPNKLLIKPDYSSESAYIRHFITKTIEEYITIKMKRGYPDNLKEDFLRLIDENKFFTFSNRTEEKEKIFQELFKKNFGNE